MFGQFFLSNLRDALSSLVSRDHRMKLFETGFWVIDKSLASRTGEVSVHQVRNLLSLTALENIPWVYDFRVRAKVFAH